MARRTELLPEELAAHTRLKKIWDGRRKQHAGYVRLYPIKQIMLVMLQSNA